MSPTPRLAVAALAGLTVTLAMTGCSSGSSSTAASDGSKPAAPGSASPTAATGTVSPAAAEGAQHLDVNAFATLVATPGVVTLDVRTLEEYAAGHLPGAKLADVQAADFDTRIAALDKTATYAVYCRSGHRSGIALQHLTAAGFTHTFDLSGGITAWTAAQRPVTTG